MKLGLCFHFGCALGEPDLATILPNFLSRSAVDSRVGLELFVPVN